MNNKAIGQRIRTARETARITQEELGLAVGCTPKHISAIERGIKSPSLDTFIDIANAIGTSADYLLQDVLDCSVDSLAGELASVISHLPPKARLRVLSSLSPISKNMG